MSGRVDLRIEERDEGRVAFVSIDNDAKLNTLGSPLLTALRDALLGLAGDDGLRAAVLSGAGERAFSGGADITEMARLDPAGACAFISLLHETCQAARDLPVPVIARLRGWVLGAGLELAAACDLRIAAEDAKLGMPEVRIGIPSVIEAALLPRLIGWGRTRRLVLTGEVISAAQAELWGLVEEVAAAEALDAAVERAVNALLAGGPRAIREQKRLLRAWEDQSLDQAIGESIGTFADCFAHPEPRSLMRNAMERMTQRRRV